MVKGVSSEKVGRYSTKNGHLDAQNGVFHVKNGLFHAKKWRLRGGKMSKSGCFGTIMISWHDIDLKIVSEGYVCWKISRMQ